MPDPTTTNLQLNVPAHLSDSGAWDSSLNTNFTIIDGVWGGVANIALSSSNVTLVPAQWQQQIIKLTGTLTTDVAVIFPALGSHHVIYNNVDGGVSDFVVVLTTNAGNQIALPPGEVLDISIDGFNVDFRNLGRVGDYWDFGGSAVPRWIGQCSIPPYLLCDGSPFNGVTYPALFRRLPGGVLPDARGRSRFALNQGTGRVTTGNSGVNGDAILSAGGDELTQAHTHTASSSVADPKHSHTYNQVQAGSGGQGGSGIGNVAGTTGLSATGITVATTVDSALSGGSQNMPPAYIGGLVFIRAA